MQEKIKEYGLDRCNASISFHTVNLEDEICVGRDNYNSGQTYIRLKSSAQIYVVKSYPINRFRSSIYEKIEKKMFPYEDSDVDIIRIRLHKELMKNYPALFEKFAGKNEFEIFAEEIEENGEKNRIFKIKDAVDIPPQEVSSIFYLLKSIHFSAIAESLPAISKTTPILEVDFFNEAFSKGEPKKITSYRLWNKPYPLNLIFIPSTESKREIPQKENALAISGSQLGVYNLKQFENFKMDLKNLDTFLKNRQRPPSSQNAKKQKEKSPGP